MHGTDCAVSDFFALDPLDRQNGLLPNRGDRRERLISPANVPWRYKACFPINEAPHLR
jgi:hypothetical protein